MYQEPTLQINVDEFYRCGERFQQPADIKSSDSAQKMDINLREKIDFGLWNDDILRVTDYGEIDIRVKNSIVYLSGHMLSVTNWQRVEKVLTQVDNIRGVINNLALDDQLMRDVSVSLSRLEHRYQCKFFTGVSNGIVVLNGSVSNTNLRLRAELCVARHPRVRGIVNYIRVPGVDFDGQDRRILQPPIGKQISFTDGVSGTIRQVVINPGNRRVIAMIIQGQIYGSAQGYSLSNNSAAHTARQLMVIPAEIIGYLTKSSGFLTVKSTDFTKYQKFDASLYAAPATGWVPPYPYCPEDVLFPLEAQSVEDQDLDDELLANDSLGG